MDGYRFIRVVVPDADRAEVAGAEAWEAGAEGIEEQASREGTCLLVYTPEPRAEAVRTALCDALDGHGVVGPAEVVEPVDWSTAWTQGMRATVISDRLLVRPSFLDVELAAGQVELVIDPGQAFGTGGHASTRLALEWVDEWARRGELCDDTRVLDVGTGTGVLAMAALRLGAGRAVGFDLDPVAVAEAGTWARHNGLGDRLQLFSGPIEALGPGASFDRVIANLLRTEMLPLAADLARLTAPGGSLALSGLLEREGDPVAEALAPLGFVLDDRRLHRDDTDTWIAPHFRKR